MYGSDLISMASEARLHFEGKSTSNHILTRFTVVTPIPVQASKIKLSVSNSMHRLQPLNKNKCFHSFPLRSSVVRCGLLWVVLAQGGERVTQYLFSNELSGMIARAYKCQCGNFFFHFFFLSTYSSESVILEHFLRAILFGKTRATTLK